MYTLRLKQIENGIDYDEKLLGEKIAVNESESQPTLLRGTSFNFSETACGGCIEKLKSNIKDADIKTEIYSGL